jgi:hypothetical protein
MFLDSLSWSSMLFHKVDTVSSKRRLPQVFVLVVGTWRSEATWEGRECDGTYGFTSSCILWSLTKNNPYLPNYMSTFLKISSLHQT